MSDQGRDKTPVTIRMLEREYHKNGLSIAVSLAINEDYAWLPLNEIAIEFTGEIEANKKIINVTMPMWLAMDKRLA